MLRKKVSLTQLESTFFIFFPSQKCRLGCQEENNGNLKKTALIKRKRWTRRIWQQFRGGITNPKLVECPTNTKRIFIIIGTVLQYVTS